MIRPIDSMRRWWTGNGAQAGSHSGDHTGGNGAQAPAAADRQLPAPAPQAPAHAGHSPAPEPAWLARLDEAGFPRSLVYPGTTLGRLLDQSADRFPQATAMAYGDSRWTYRELLNRVNRMAGGLASLGVRRGERVLMALPNCPEFVVAFLAIQKLGAVVVNVGPLMGVDDLKQAMAMTTPHVAIGLDLLAPALGRAGHRSTVEHWVWVSLQSYQPMLRRLGYQWKLWHAGPGYNQENGQGNGNGNAKKRGAQHVTLDDLIENAPARPPTIEPDPSSVAVLQPTGGTTGTLKLAELTHRSLLANASQVTSLMGCRSGQERILAVLPMFHVYGLTLCLVGGIFSTSCIILSTRFQADQTLDLLRKHKPTIFPLVPAICDALSNEIEKQQKDRQAKDKPGKDKQTKDKPEKALDGLRLCISGAAPLPKATCDRFEALTGAIVLEGYGLTEASPVTHSNLPGCRRVGSIGVPLPDTRVRVTEFDDPEKDVQPGEPGEMLICGPQIMQGYFANPEQTERALVTDTHGDTWLRTGDVVRCDEEGYFYVLDRKKDMIIRAGLKVYPGKVEKLLKTHKRIADAAVVGRADGAHTEKVVAVCVASSPLAEGEEQKLVEEVRALCREHLAPYEVPAVVEFREALPRSPLGKLLKRELREPPPEKPQPPASGKPIKDKEKAKAASSNGKEAA